MTIMEKKCDLCGSAFQCTGNLGYCWCDNIRIDESKLKKISSLGGDCFCEKCLLILKDYPNIGSDQESKIKTNEGEFKLSMKKNNDKFFIQIKSSKYGYPLLNEEYDSGDEALKVFFQYKIKLENGNFKVIKNYEALDEHYRRVYQRVRYGILF